MANTYAATVLQRTRDTGYRLRFLAATVNHTEALLVATLLADASSANFDGDNIDLMRSRVQQHESMPVLVNLVNNYQRFNDAQRTVSVNTVRPIGGLLTEIYDRFTHTFNLLREATVLELAVMAGERREVEWELVRTSTPYAKLAAIEPRFAAKLTADNAWELLLARCAELTEDFNRTQQPVGFLKITFKNRKRR